MKALSLKFREFLKKLGPKLSIDFGSIQLENIYYERKPHFRKREYWNRRYKCIYLYPGMLEIGWDKAEPNFSDLPASPKFCLSLFGFSYTSNSVDDDLPRYFLSIEYEHRQLIIDLFWLHIKEWRDEDNE